MLNAFQPLDHLPKRLESDHILIRQWYLSDLEEHEALFDDGIAHHLAPWFPLQTPGQTPSQKRRAAREKILMALDRWETGTDYRFFIIEKSTNKIVGQIAITGIVRNVNQSAFIGYWIGWEHLNKGLATEATILAFEYAFEYLKLHRISLWISPDNAPSIQVAKKLELRYEGQIKSALFLGGRWQDTEIYSILSDEWETRRAELKMKLLR
ncbi:MAG: GNAT family protein [Candidatus Kapaibacterium sp.]|jgi:ribosomal-protein-alanine N-acetyltransferase